VLYVETFINRQRATSTPIIDATWSLIVTQDESDNMGFCKKEKKAQYFYFRSEFSYCSVGWVEHSDGVAESTLARRWYSISDTCAIKSGVIPNQAYKCTVLWYFFESLFASNLTRPNLWGNKEQGNNYTAFHTSIPIFL
jgi:hypothetical protein